MDSPDKIAQLVGSIPFMLYIKGKGPHVNTVRVIEILISSALTIGVLYGILSTEAKNTREELQVIKQELRDIRRDLYEPRALRIPR
jgi:hypothetical protein